MYIINVVGREIVLEPTLAPSKNTMHLGSFVRKPVFFNIIQ